MIYRLSVALMTMLMLLTALAFSANRFNIHAKVFIDIKPQLNLFYAQHLDVVDRNNNYFEIVTNQEELNELEGLGFRTEIVIEDIEKFLISRFDPTRLMGGYPTLTEINALIDVIVTDHPDITSKVDIGPTIDGRPMWAIKISDNPGVDEDEPEVLFTSAIHAREVITPLVLLNVMDSLTDKYPGDPYIQYLVDNREIWFILNANPDGYYINELISSTGGGMYRKNGRDNLDGTFGVDLNRNFGYKWGYDDIGSSPDTDDPTYRGTGPFSEPETQNIRDFTIAHEFVLDVYYHAYSNLVLWSWGWDMSKTDDEDIYVGLGDSVCYFTGYVPNYIDPLYPVNGGSDDWNYGEQTLKDKSYSFVIEVGTYDDYFWPPTYRIEPLVNENYWSTLFLIEVSDSVEQAMVPKPPEIILESNVNGSSFQVGWDHNDDYNPGVNYELVEYSDFAELTDPGNNFDNFINNGYLISYSRYNSGYSSFHSGMSTPNFSAALMTRTPISFAPGEMLSFWAYYKIEEAFDYAYVAVSSDGVNWTNLEGSITTNDDPNGKNQGNGITGTSPGWIQVQFDMSAYAGQIMHVAFVYDTDESIQLEGMYIDDIEKVTVYNNETVVSSSITDNFYTITGKPDETFLLYKVKAQDADLQWGGYSVIVGTLTSPAYICGDVDGVEGINILDVVFLINYKYKGGPAPDPEVAGDVDGIVPINILDVVYLINSIYRDGPDPACP